MSDVPQGTGWWLASDGRYYPPPQPQPLAQPPQPQAQPLPAHSAAWSPVAPSAAARWPSGRAIRVAIALLGLLIVLAVVIPLVATAAKSLAAVPLGPGTATLTWTSSPSVTTGSASPSFSGTIAGYPVSGTATTPSPSSAPSTGSGSGVSHPSVVGSFTGSLGGVPFSVVVSFDLDVSNTSSSAGLPLFTITGTFGSDPVNGTITSVGSSAAIHFSATIGSYHVTGTISGPRRRGEANTAMASFVVSR